MAILMALESEKVEILGLTIVHGNVNVDTGAKNAVRLVEMAGQGHVSVRVGQFHSLICHVKYVALSLVWH